ncbi:glycosyltransferase family 4 protein [Candidatus Gottesmanbacteria bacterium]|nr:glycosyltransferase family 4 protein [Candidatus Gottesmanbacteria bacterium]
MRIAIVKPPIIGSFIRGVGFYTQRLYQGLIDLGISVELVDFSWNENFAAGFDLIHYSYFDPFFLTLPVIKRQKLVITIHDLIPLIFSESFPRGIRGEIKWQLQKRLLHFSDAVITVSKASKADIVKQINFPESKIFVTYEAADKIFKPIKIKKEEFVLYVGGTNWNKNVITLVKACQKIKMPLVLVGKEFVNKNIDFSNVENQPLKEILDAARMTNNIRFLGFVKTKELVKLYNQAKAYVQPSIYEGFGLPVLEAMACGTPVICGRNSSLLEIAGDAATYADITDPNDLADKIRNIKATGQEITQAQKFSWEKTAKETLIVYESIHNCSRL